MIYFKEQMNDIEHVQSRSYTELKAHLARYPNGAIGVELNADGLMQHYLYQLDAETAEIRRYPLRKMGGKYSCMKMFARLTTEKEEPLFGAPQQVTGTAPELPKAPLFFVEEDRQRIEAIKLTARTEILKPSDKAPYFPDLPLTEAQQAFLYSGQVKKGISFQEELSKLLDNPDVTIDEKERALRTCISKNPEDVSADIAVQKKVLQSEFLTLHSILTYPVEMLGSERMAGRGNPPPTIGAIRDYYVACIQSHLQPPVAKEDLSRYGNADFELAKHTRLAEKPTAEIVEAPTYKPLSEKEEICLGALNVLLMSREGENTPENLKKRMLENPKFMEVLDEVYIMLSDLKNVADKKNQTTEHTEYEMIYREFFAELVAEDENRQDALLQLSALSPAHRALTALTESQVKEWLWTLMVHYETAETGAREDMLKRLLAIRKGSTNPRLIDEVNSFLFFHDLMSMEEKGSLLLSYVVRGNQIAAERIVEKAPELLKMEGTATDYSGRTFRHCTAYEYAWWAKDTHMRRMLESYMDRETKAELLARIDAIEANGLTYTQADREITGSKQFDLTQLKTAYRDYISTRDVTLTNLMLLGRWANTTFVQRGTSVLNAAWMRVGIAQRDLPVHYINEYFRKDRSFEPRPNFNEQTLPREFIFYNYNTSQTETLFPLVLTDSTGLGVDFAFYRAWNGSAVGEGSKVTTGDDGSQVDLEAVSKLDEVRTEDLKQSRKNLEAPASNLGMSR